MSEFVDDMVLIDDVQLRIALAAHNLTSSSISARVCSWPAGPQFQVAATEI